MLDLHGSLCRLSVFKWNVLLQEDVFLSFRLLDQLPRANVILLRYLFGVLYNIEKNSSTNQMNAFNLAVCVTPSLIWPPTSSSPELEHEFTKKVMTFLHLYALTD